MQYIIAIAIAVMLYLFQSRYYRKHWSDGLTVDIAYNRTAAHIGDTVELIEQISNRKRLPLPVLYVKFKTSRSFRFETEENAAVSDYYYRNDVFSILGCQQVTRKLSFRPAVRGYFIIDSASLVANDLFITKSYACIRDNYASLYVYPKLLRSRDTLSLTNSIIGEILSRDLYEDPFSFRGIRDYTGADNMRQINWKATAKNQRLMVNTFFDTRNTQVVILLNLDTHTMQRMDTLKEYIISVAATLANQLIIRGFSVRLAANVPDSVTGSLPVTESGAGNGHLHTLFQCLARLDVTKELTDICTLFDQGSLFDETDKSAFYLLLSNYRKPDLVEKCAQKQALGYSLYFLCPEFPAHCRYEDFSLNESSAMLSNVHFWEVTQDET